VPWDFGTLTDGAMPALSTSAGTAGEREDWDEDQRLDDQRPLLPLLQRRRLGGPLRGDLLRLLVATGEAELLRLMQGAHSCLYCCGIGRGCRGCG
jgi:hypothetical protein